MKVEKHQFDADSNRTSPQGTGKSHPEMLEGAEAAGRFTTALKAILSVPKSAVPNPFTKPKRQKKR